MLELINLYQLIFIPYHMNGGITVPMHLRLTPGYILLSRKFVCIPCR
jgi:hypothetical protein